MKFTRTLATVAASLIAAAGIVAPAHAAIPAAEVAGDTPRATVSLEPNFDYKPRWRPKAHSYGDRVDEIWAWSPSMNRHVPFVWIKPADNSVPRPTLYLLNGGDGGEGRANWLMQTDVVDFYWDKNVNVVIPMSGKFSYYLDWAEENAYLGGKQMWETFLTKELPEPLEAAIGANGKRAIAGMSMTATTTLLYAEHLPGFYDAIGSFSGCAQTTRGLGYAGLFLTLDRGNARPEQMLGPMNGPHALWNDALINAERLRGQVMYISNASGLAGPFDMLTSERVDGNSSMAAEQIITGGIIEGVTNACTHDLKAKLDGFGIGADWNFRNAGTHSWGYWQDDLRASWPVFARALGV